jgi:hypothetical protein
MLRLSNKGRDPGTTDILTTPAFPPPRPTETHTSYSDIDLPPTPLKVCVLFTLKKDTPRARISSRKSIEVFYPIIVAVSAMQALTFSLDFAINFCFSI